MEISQKIFLVSLSKLLGYSLNLTATAISSDKYLLFIRTMTVVSLAELSKINSETSTNKRSFYVSKNSKLQQRLDLLIQQKRLDLPLENILANHPIYARWLKEIEQSIPGIFQSNKQLYLNLNIKAKLEVERQSNFWIEVPINLAKIKDKYKLLEWKVEQKHINWQTYVKLWAATNYLNLAPEKLAVIICNFSRKKKLEKLVIKWNERQYLLTQQFLQNIIVPDTVDRQIEPKDIYSFEFELDSIKEIPI
jgi:hypothetical protein